MGDIISLAEYKRKKGIAPPRSPYYTLKASRQQIDDAIHNAAAQLQNMISRNGSAPCYAVLIGYEEKNGNVKLLKGLYFYPDKETFERCAGHRNQKAIALIAK